MSNPAEETEIPEVPAEPEDGFPDDHAGEEVDDPTIAGEDQ